MQDQILVTDKFPNRIEENDKFAAEILKAAIQLSPMLFVQLEMNERSLIICSQKFSRRLMKQLNSIPRVYFRCTNSYWLITFGHSEQPSGTPAEPLSGAFHGLWPRALPRAATRGPSGQFASMSESRAMLNIRYD